MEFRIADTFTQSLAKLTGDEQKAAKTTAFDLQLDPSNPGMKFHKLDRAKDRNFWSVRVSRDIRLIVHRTASSFLLCYVDHHDPAYRWAERRKLERHPKTGAAQLVEIRETVREIEVPTYVPVADSSDATQAPPELPEPVGNTPATEAGPPILADVTDETLLGYGVPPEWVHEVLQASEDGLLEVVEHLPGEAAEAVLALATGTTPEFSHKAPPEADPFDHPDAVRRFRVMTNAEELARALEYPWDRWMVFLHPAQQAIVERSYSGPAKVAGSAGTGKTIVAIHRAAYLARSNPDGRVLLTTFSDNLASSLRSLLRRLLHSEPRLGERLEVASMTSISRRLYEANLGPVKVAGDEEIRSFLIEALEAEGRERFGPDFLWAEWTNVVDAWQLKTWEAYRDVPRLGRKSRLSESHRKNLWAVFARVRGRLAEKGLTTQADLLGQLTKHVANAKHQPFEHVVVDEAQDVSVAELRFLGALGGDRPNGLFFAGDLGQRIFRQPFSWKSLGVEVRGRSSTLRINYRTSHQIRTQADRLLAPELRDVDGNAEVRKGTVSVFNGVAPRIEVIASQDDETTLVVDQVRGWLEGGIEPGEVALFVRSARELPRAEKVGDLLGVPTTLLASESEPVHGKVTISTMHRAKGLEFRAVVVMACDDDVIPSEERIDSVTDDADLEEVYQTERHLLYVACTRARDHLLVVGVDPGSEFVDDLTGN